ncbi:hypothetical protein ADK57_27700 [Streptomyces sp. MMG1533]|uniref:Lrp/AsnC family transcriptional regulator n=1 Tax=Streptomyces sp. MMG1533 TaxID=1415546 RepID=UPI0006AEC54E|nr:Lrp/AsnC ligand binding domain-containing protein [Streptomyces sp. MMG1533]KOU61538.1 hypothetical protein ADK57_27700 [Streptomyces sp. MMG1533]
MYAAGLPHPPRPAHLLPERLGQTLNATLWLRVAPARLKQVGQELARHAEVAFAGAISGRHNLMVAVTCRDAEDFYRHLTTRVAAIDGIDACEVSIRVRRLKQAASLISHGRLVHPAPAEGRGRSRSPAASAHSAVPTGFTRRLRSGVLIHPQNGR